MFIQDVHLECSSKILNITKGNGPCRCVVEKGTFLVKCLVPKVIWTIRWSDVPDPYNEDEQRCYNLELNIRLNLYTLGNFLMKNLTVLSICNSIY